MKMKIMMMSYWIKRWRTRLSSLTSRRLFRTRVFRFILWFILLICSFCAFAVIATHSDKSQTRAQEKRREECSCERCAQPLTTEVQKWREPESAADQSCAENVIRRRSPERMATAAQSRGTWRHGEWYPRVTGANAERRMAELHTRAVAISEPKCCSLSGANYLAYLFQLVRCNLKLLRNVECTLGDEIGGLTRLPELCTMMRFCYACEARRFRGTVLVEPQRLPYEHPLSSEFWRKWPPLDLL